MAYLHDDVLDNGLSELSNATTFHLCSSEPVDRADVLTKSLGSKDTIVVNAPSDRTAGGKEVIVDAIIEGNITSSGTAIYWALIDGTRLLATNTLVASQSVTEDNTFSLDSFIAVGIPDPYIYNEGE